MSDDEIPDATLRAVWDNNGLPRRYVPLGYGLGGAGWGIWDRKRRRYVEKPGEAAKIDTEEPFAN